MARMTFAAIAAVLLVACCAQQAAAAGRALKTSICTTPPKCPTGYTLVDISSTTACNYYCQRPAALNCPPGPAQEPRICGGTTEKLCPSIACASASSYAISGPNGCAKARSSIEAVAFSSTKYAIVEAIIKPYVYEFCPSGPGDELNVLVPKYVNMYADAVAATFINYNQYVCTCCLGNSAAYSTVGADVQGVAAAIAYAYQAISLEVYCGDHPIALAAADAEALAFDTQLAIDSVYKEYTKTSSKNGVCTATGLKKQMATAIAKATACTFAVIGARVVDQFTEGITYACADSIAISGLDGLDAVCPLYFNCPVQR